MQYGGVLNSPLGEILICDDGQAILEVRFLDSPILTQYTKSPLTLDALMQIQEYFSQKRTIFTLPLKPRGTAFEQSVWEALCAIPYGKVRSYKDVAKAIHNANAARAIGGANHRNPIAILIPCHRVISADGSINGYAGGIEKKIALLKLEGYQPKMGLCL